MDISIVVPVFNEEDNIPILYKELRDALDGLDKEYEIIFIDDGSQDKSLDKLRRLKRPHPFIKIVSFEKNYGQSAALKIGFEKARGDIIITIDSDLQNSPYDIPKLLSYIEKGYDVVSGWRRYRQDSLKKRAASTIANYIRNKIIKDNIKDTGCTLKVYRRDYIKRLKLYNGLHRFLPAILKMEGARIIEVEIAHRKRRFGKSKYGIRNRILKPFVDALAVLWMKKNTMNPEIKEEI